jgi:preprotein translocase subunit SecF
MRKEDLMTIFNVSINETLGRTILTSGTVMMVVLILFFFGGPVIHDFTTALIIGLISGPILRFMLQVQWFLFWERTISRRKKGGDKRVIPRQTEFMLL